MLNDAGVYAIRCAAAGRVYVGCSVALRARWAAHRRVLRLGRHANQPLQAAWRKFGEASFVFEVLERTEDRSQLRALEREWVIRLRSLRTDIGFNIAAPAASRPVGAGADPERRPGPQPRLRWARVAELVGRAQPVGGVGSLAETGHKLTTPRRRVLDALRAAGGPLAAQEVAERAGTSVASTYRALALLTELGVVSEVEEHGGTASAGEGRTRRYALCTLHGHHHHFVCRECHATLDVQSEALERALAELERRAGLDIERHEVLLSGRCSRCSGHALPAEPGGERA